MSEFKSATTDFAELKKRTEDLFGEPWYAQPGAANGVDTTKRDDDPHGADPGHYPGY